MSLLTRLCRTLATWFHWPGEPIHLGDTVLLACDDAEDRVAALLRESPYHSTIVLCDKSSRYHAYKTHTDLTACVQQPYSAPTLLVIDAICDCAALVALLCVADANRLCVLIARCCAPETLSALYPYVSCTVLTPDVPQTYAITTYPHMSCTVLHSSAVAALERQCAARWTHWRRKRTEPSEFLAAANVADVLHQGGACRHVKLNDKLTLQKVRFIA